MSDMELKEIELEFIDKYNISPTLIPVISSRLRGIRHRRNDNTTYKIANKLIELELMINGMV